MGFEVIRLDFEVVRLDIEEIKKWKLKTANEMFAVFLYNFCNFLDGVGWVQYFAGILLAISVGGPAGGDATVVGEENVGMGIAGH